MGGLLAGKAYDPAAAVTLSTAALLAMTAMDTTNLRLSGWTVPASGIVEVRAQGVMHGATTCPQCLVGVLEGSTVRGRQAPHNNPPNLAATTLYPWEVCFPVTGLTPGATPTWDLAYSVETIVASTGIKYGGPNDATANNAFGCIVFEVWDPT